MNCPDCLINQQKFRNFRISKPLDRQLRFSSETSINIFWGSKIVQHLVGIAALLIVKREWRGQESLRPILLLSKPSTFWHSSELQALLFYQSLFWKKKLKKRLHHTNLPMIVGMKAKRSRMLDRDRYSWCKWREVASLFFFGSICLLISRSLFTHQLCATFHSRLFKTKEHLHKGMLIWTG